MPLVVKAIGVDGVVEIVKQLPAVAGDEIDAANLAFLQGLVGIQSIAEQLRRQRATKCRGM